MVLTAAEPGWDTGQFMSQPVPAVFDIAAGQDNEFQALPWNARSFSFRLQHRIPREPAGKTPPRTWPPGWPQVGDLPKTSSKIRSDSAAGIGSWNIRALSRNKRVSAR